MSDTATYADFSIKARFADLVMAQAKLLSLGARFVGEDVQTDTYFRVPMGKMKLREGNIENLLTHYLRENVDGKMKTTIFLYEWNPSAETIQHHTSNLTQIGKVIKRRRIFFIDNVKFHLDVLESGSRFLEIEAIDREGTLGLDHIRTQASEYARILGIRQEDVLPHSYIDMRA
jgi:adenylate cyclase class 2